LLAIGLRDGIIYAMNGYESSWIENFAYVPSKQELSIETTKGSIYTFEGVPEEVANDMAEADSVGKFYHENLKGKYSMK
tara:strand:- start:934 stop:1170 length:237 start_codon:yes stop_codon:yes gene_type:complete